MRRSRVFFVVALLGALLGAALSARAADLPMGLVQTAGKKVKALRFKGNKKAEDDAIRLVMSTQKGDAVDPDKIRDDLRAIWRMGMWEDVQIEAEGDDDEVTLTVIVREKPSIRKIYVSGNKEVSLDKINEVLDLKKDAIVEASKIKRNIEKVKDLYIEKGFYLADVSSDLRRVDDKQVDVYILCDENAKVEVRQIRFLGNKNATEAELHAAMQTQEGGWLSFITSSGTYREDAFDRDLLLLTSYYYDKGFITVKLGKPQVELSADKRYVYITIPVEEGLPYDIGKLDFKGELLKPADELLKKMVTKPSTRFNRTKLSKDIMALNDLYKDAGYAYVNIQPLTAIDADKRLVHITFDIQKGQLVYFGKIFIRGNTKTRDKVIRRELRIYEGDLYNQTRFERSKKLVQALGFFEKVEFTTKSVEGTDRIDTYIEVTERPTGTFQIGAGFSSAENFIGQAQISQNNLFGHGTSLQLQAQISSLRQLFTLRYVDPYFLDTRITFAFSIYNQLLYYPGFSRTARGGDLTWGYLIGDHTRIFGTYKLENVAVKQSNLGNLGGGAFAPTAQAGAGTISNLFRSGWTSSIRLSLNYDTRDDRMFPRKGMYHSLAFEFADPLIASQAVFTRLSGFARFYYPIWGPIIFRTNLEGGLVTSRSSQGVPIYERYFVGGINSIRGFTLYSLGPKVNVLQTQDPNSALTQFNIGGNLQLTLNTEIEFPIIPQVQIKGVIFFDAGNAWNLEQSRYCPSRASVSNIADVSNPCTPYPTGHNLRYSAGFGLRWVSPIGPLRFEWGIPLNRQPHERNIVFEFTIGNFF